MTFLDSRRRVVVKVGSSLLVNDSGNLRTDWLASLAADVADLDADVLLVSSGAVALGRARLGLSGKLSLVQKQACAAAGQVVLAQGYERAFAAHGRQTAQALLTLHDTEDRRRWLNARGTLDTLLSLGAVPVVNENDTVATDEIRYGDNDRLAARTAQLVGADALVLLSDIDGLYTANPRVSEDAQHIEVIEDLSADIMAMGGEAGSTHGTGGMATKLLAARIALAAGCDLAIHDGRAEHPLARLATNRFTWFRAPASPLSARRQWIAGSLDARGQVHVDEGAAKAVAADKSLLLAGVTRINGEFGKGDAVDIVCGETIARGLAAYGAEDARRVAGRRSGEVEAVLGYTNGGALVHRDDLVRL